MNKIYKYKDYCKLEELNLSKVSSDMQAIVVENNRKRKIIEDIIKECLRDFCVSNSLSYEIVFGQYAKTGIFIPEGLELNDFIGTKFLSGRRGFKIIINRGSGHNIPKIGMDLDNNEEFKNCITHLKFYLDKELDIKIKIDSTKENDYVSEIEAQYE